MNIRTIIFSAATLAVAVTGAFAQQGNEPDLSRSLLSGALIMKKSLPDPLEAGWEGEKVCELLHENDQTRALRCTFPPGAGHEKHFHAAHFGYILEGGKMYIKDKTGSREIETKTGATWWSDGIAWHEAVNIGDTTSVYIIVEPKQAAGE